MSTPRSGCRGAWQEWWAGTRNVRLWSTLARYDILLRYRRSMLGPLWLTIGMATTLAAMGPLYATLFNVPLARFFPHLTLGIILWQFVSAATNDGCNSLTAATGHLKHGDHPLSLFAWRSVARHVLQFAHHAVLFVPVALWAGLSLSPVSLLAVPGFLIVLVNLHASTLWLGIACARFRDITQIVASILSLLMFVTPVFWMPESLPKRARFVLYNPFAQMLDVIRQPLLGQVPTAGQWGVLLAWTACNVLVAAVVFARSRRHVVYWL